MVRTGERNLFHDRSIVYAVTGFGLNPTLAILQNNSKLHKIFLSLFTRININLYSLILSERPVIWMLHLNFTVSDIYKRWCWKYNFGETILTYHWKLHGNNMTWLPKPGAWSWSDKIIPKRWIVVRPRNQKHRDQAIERTGPLQTGEDAILSCHLQKL